VCFARIQIEVQSNTHDVILMKRLILRQVGAIKAKPRFRLLLGLAFRTATSAETTFPTFLGACQLSNIHLGTKK
jgi:hypothetical protein